MFFDGKSFAEDELVIALGITGRGENVIQTTTENEAVLTAFLRQLASRGLRREQGLLSIIDGAKGLRAAIRLVFGPSAFVQRCQWQKQENVRCLPKAQQGPGRRRKLQAAWEQPTYAEAKAALDALQRDLRRQNLSAAESLAEGLEEPLLLHRLGLFLQLGVSLKTTNSIESLLAQVGQRRHGRPERAQAALGCHRAWTLNRAFGRSEALATCRSSARRLSRIHSN